MVLKWLNFNTGASSVVTMVLIMVVVNAGDIFLDGLEMFDFNKGAFFCGPVMIMVLKEQFLMGVSIIVI